MSVCRPSSPTVQLAHDTFMTCMTLFGTAKQNLQDLMRSDSAFQGLSPLHLRLLALCVDGPGCTQQQLADRVGRDKGQVAHLIHKLESMALLARQPDALDGRQLRLWVSAEGAALAERFTVLEAGYAERLFSELDASALQDLQRAAHTLLARAQTRE